MKSKTIELYTSIFFIILLITIIFFKLISFDYFWFNTFGDRSLVRSLNLSTIFQISGAETNFGSGARVPGGFSYYYLWFFLQFTKDIKEIYLIFSILTITSFVFLAYTIKQYLNLLSFTLICIFFFTSKLINMEILRFWNPVLGLHLLIFSYAFFFRFLKSKKFLELFYCYIFCYLSTQFHLSFFSIAITFLLISLFIKKENKFNFIFNIVIFLFSIIICYISNIFHIFYPFSNLDIIIKPSSLDINQYIDLNFQLLRNFLSTIYNIQSFTQVPGNVSYKLPLMSIIIGFLAFIILLKPDFKIENKKNYYEVFKILSFIILLTLIFYSISLTFGQYNYEGKQVIGFTLLYQSRYFLAVSPIFAILSGISFAIIIKKLLTLKNKFFSIFFLITIFLLILLRVTVTNIDNFDKNNIAFVNWFTSYENKKIIFDKINNEFNLSKKDFYNKVALTRFINNNIVPDTNTLEFLINTKNDNNQSNINYKNCILSISSENYLKKENIINKIYQFNKFKINIDKIFLIDNITNNNFKIYLISYKTKNESCMTNMGNSYIFNSKERIIKEFFDDYKNHEINTYVNKSTKNYHEIFLTIPLKQSAFNLNIGIELYIDNNKLEIIINGKRLRNKAQLDGYWETVNILKPKIKLLNKISNEQILIDIHEGILGRDLVYSPFSLKYHLLKKGKYKVYFIADEIYESHTNIKEGHSEGKKDILRNINIKMIDEIIFD